MWHKMKSLKTIGKAHRLGINWKYSHRIFNIKEIVKISLCRSKPFLVYRLKRKKHFIPWFHSLKKNLVLKCCNSYLIIIGGFTNPLTSLRKWLIANSFHLCTILANNSIVQIGRDTASPSKQLNHLKWIFKHINIF